MKQKNLYSLVGILLIVVIVVLVNLVANSLFFRVDLTEEKLFSLSTASKDVVQNLENRLTVKVFASKDMPAQLKDIERFLGDLLANYRRYGGGNFHYEFIDPGNDKDLEKEAADYQIAAFPVEVWSKDKREQMMVYFGMSFLYGDKQETIPAVQSTAGLEYNITSIIKRISSQQSKKIGFLTGHGEPSPFEKMTMASNILQDNYQITTVDLSAEDMVPADVDVLLIVEPQAALSDADKVKVDQFIMGGGGLGWMGSKTHVEMQQMQAQRLPLMMDPMTEHYGFRINEDVVADAQCGQVMVPTRMFFQQAVKYPFLPMVTTFNKKHPITKDLEVISLLFPSSVDTSITIPGVERSVLFKSGAKSFVEMGPRFNISVRRQYSRDGAEFDRAFVPLGVALEGKFTSFYAGKEIPVDDNGEPVIAMDRLAMESPDDTRMFAMGDGRFLMDEYRPNAANINLLMNVVDWLANDTGLIELRSREVLMRPLKEQSPTQMQVWKLFNWFLPPILVILLGLVYWQIRRNTRKREG